MTPSTSTSYGRFSKSAKSNVDIPQMMALGLIGEINALASSSRCAGSGNRNAGATDNGPVPLDRWRS